MRRDDPRDYADLIDDLFVIDGARYGPYVRKSHPEVVVPGRLVRTLLGRPEGYGDSYEYELSLFCDIRGFAGELWEHEMRTLLRLQTLNHPALPKIISGSFLLEEEVAFTLTRIGGQAMQADGGAAWARKNPLQAFEQFSILLDALNHLHGARMMHRNLTTGALRVMEDSSGQMHIQLTRFEMSALIGNIVRRARNQDPDSVRDVVRDFYMAPPSDVEQTHHLAYLAPETHDYLFHERPTMRRDSETTDVFGLGVLGWEWFCGPIPELLEDAYAEARATEGPAKAVALARLHDRMRSHLTTRTDLPKALTSLLRRMLASSSTSRATSFDALRQLEQHWESIRGHWEELKEEKPYLVAFMPLHSVETLYEQRGWLSHSPAELAGQQELQAFLADELRQAELVWSPNGAVGYASDEAQRLEQAQWVLIGRQAVWFCAFLFVGDLLNKRGKFDEHTLVIKYFRERDQARELATARPRRRISRIDLVPFQPGQTLEGPRKGRPSWEPLIRSVKNTKNAQPEDELFLRSLDFLLKYQRADLDSRKYPFRRLDNSSNPGYATIQIDERRENEWRHRSALFSAYSDDPNRRPPLGDFPFSLDDENEHIDLEIVSGRRPHFPYRPTKVTFVERKDESTIVVRPHDPVPVPAVGWLRPVGENGAEVQYSRQIRARQSLGNQSALIQNLHTPNSFDLGRGRWLGETYRELRGDASRHIRDMLAFQPFYALQGPPGTGKTTVAKHAVKKHLETEPGARILASAQSNFALDNLAEGLIEILPQEALILRETPSGQTDEDTVTSTQVLEHTLPKLTSNVSDRIRRLLTHALHPERLSESERRACEAEPNWERPDPQTAQERALADEWLNTVKDNQIELTERISAGASVVLATTSISSTLTETARSLDHLFDWVLVEEAAKAWPTEVIIPLVLGTRWTLIGDHRQLGAFREEDLERFLRSLHKDHDKELRQYAQDEQQHLRTLRLFGSLFESRPDGSPSPRGRTSSPLGRLEHQFRMHPNIAEPVGRAFYPVDDRSIDEDGLPRSFLRSDESARRDHGVVRPDPLKGRALVWIDTGQAARPCQDEPFWSNQGEADLIAHLLERMSPKPLSPAEPPDLENGLVVLTPYRKQKRLLEGLDVLRGRVHTVHSFQGREADRVVVSLVRSTPIGNTVMSNVGHVGKEEVANVLLSRAKRLLVLVGDFDHMATRGGSCWQVITDTFLHYGHRIPAAELED